MSPVSNKDIFYDQFSKPLYGLSIVNIWIIESSFEQVVENKKDEKTQPCLAYQFLAGEDVKMLAKW